MVVVAVVVMESEASTTNPPNISTPVSLLATTSSSPSPPLHLTSVAKKFSSRTGHFDNKNRRGSLTTKEQDEEKRTPEIEDENVVVGISLDNVGVSSSKVSVDRKPFPELPGLQLDL
ncbi:hypothetical protein PVK06_027192 [Gossypium arboreum]|uniref:Uncharacterized protein n=2 Tax=Gossypium arboreum TaxID=29729 RepID=A0ABR0NZQ3_GOSAR|nr:hypothetical protein PVK06_027192 [Gossypium arboreum]